VSSIGWLLILTFWVLAAFTVGMLLGSVIKHAQR